MSEQSNKPVINIRDRLLSISIFKRDTIDNTSGQLRTYYSTNLQRSYQEKDNKEWKREQINLYPEDLLRLSLLCQNAYADLKDYIQANKNDIQTKADYPAQSFDSSEPPAYLNDDIPF